MASPEPDTPLAPRTRLSREERRNQILGIAHAHFVRSGFAGARVAEIASEAGVTDAVIYQHFQSKDELFQHALVEPLRKLVASQIATIEQFPIGADPAELRPRAHAYVRAQLTAMAS